MPGTKLKDRVDQAAQTQALAKPGSSVLSIFQDATVKTQVAAAIGSSSALTAERLLVVALNDCRRNPALLDCTRNSMVGALLLAAQLRLEVGGALGHFYLVPFKNNKRGGIKEVTPILGYKGMIVLARRSGEISDISARAVYSNDLFTWEYGIEDKLVHKPAMFDRGAIVAFYGVARFTNGGHQMLVMSKTDVDKYRGRSRAAEADSGPWKTDYEPMGAKTVIRRMAPFLPLTTEAATAIAEDEERELGLTPEGVLDLAALGFPNGDGKEHKETSAVAEGGGAESMEATGQNAGQPEEAPTEPSSATPADPAESSPPASGPELKGSILRDPPEDPGAAFRR